MLQALQVEAHRCAAEGGKESLRRQAGIGSVGNSGRWGVIAGATEVTRQDPVDACFDGCDLAFPGGCYHGGHWVGHASTAAIWRSLEVVIAAAIGWER